MGFRLVASVCPKPTCEATLAHLLVIELPGGTSTFFPASRQGRAFIAARVKLPSPCVTPIVFITGDEGEWLTVTGADNGPRVSASAVHQR